MTKRELWKKVVGFEGFYEVSNTGRVRGVERKVPYKNGWKTVKGVILKPRINNCGYVEVRLNRGGNSNTKFVHVLVAMAFIPNPYKKPQVNHLDGVKTNNDVRNLQWATASENMRHAYMMGLCKVPTKTVVDVCTGIVYTSSKDAARKLGLKHSTLRNYLYGKAPFNPTCLKYSK